uniref:4-hydroxy-3-methylbut-2-enyl diphosphate reductase n=1 Tax=Parolsenella massiliensis TaxID=1871022 RepID=UPI0009336C3F|nr:4-hydroxy-3-methylbut-2-enyl diphosphate reductase [Parolsenella massiliensis]
MPKITVAEHAGACYGVQRALDLVQKVAREATGPIHTLGPLIHNPQVVEGLAAEGVTVVSDVPAEPGSTLVLRTHGVVPQVEKTARERGLHVVDATCPYVKRVHHAAERLQSEGYQVLVVGEAGHPEVEAILGHAPGAGAVSCVDELDEIELGRRVGVVVQTTQAKPTLDAVVSELMARTSEVCVINTICEATSERQKAARELAASSDVMVVIGGRNSANTTRLATICSASCERTHHIETCDELEVSWFVGAKCVGVTAGASTPTAQIDELVASIESLCASLA